MKYTVITDTETIRADLLKSAAVRIAEQAALANSGKNVFISWFRKSDGQHGYLNPNGDHAITGKTW